jgi:hypothetical protein
MRADTSIGPPPLGGPLEGAYGSVHTNAPKRPGDAPKVLPPAIRGIADSALDRRTYE